MLFQSSSLVLLLLTFCTEGSIIRREDSDYDLTILHTNDVHSRYDQSNKYGTDCTKAQIENKQCYGGLARLKTAIDQLREKHPNNLLLDGGDEFQGTMYYTYYKGDITARAMNYLKYDVMTIGNHEFDNGPDNLARVAQNFTFPLVSSNIDASQHPQLSSLIKKYQLFPKYNLAVVGYITYTAPSISNLGKLLKVSDPIITLQETIDEVKKMGYKRVIAVSHNGYKEDQELASKTKGLSLIVGGHSHSYLASPLNNVTNAPNSVGIYPTSVKNLDGKDTYIVQAYCWSRFLGHVDIKFNEDGYLNKIDGFPIELNSLVPLNEEANKQAQEWREPFDAFGKTVLGVATDDFDQASCQTKECSLGSFVSDIILEKRPNSDVSFINAGGIRAGITKGDIKVSDVLTVFPFGNAIVDIKLKGDQIWDMLEAIVSKVNKVNSRPVTSFIQIGGMKFTYDPTAPAQSRLVSVDILDRKAKTTTYVKLDLQKVYTCTTLDFIATGGDNFIAPPITDFATLEATDIIVSDYVKKHTPVSPYTDGRIKIVKKGEETSTTSTITSTQSETSTSGSEVSTATTTSGSETSTITSTSVSQSSTVTSTQSESSTGASTTPCSITSKTSTYPVTTPISSSSTSCSTSTKSTSSSTYNTIIETETYSVTESSSTTSTRSSSSISSISSSLVNSSTNSYTQTGSYPVTDSQSSTYTSYSVPSGTYTLVPVTSGSSVQTGTYTFIPVTSVTATTTRHKCRSKNH